MKYQNAKLPPDAVFAGTTPVFSESTVPGAIKKRHMAPRGKCGKLMVLTGSLQFVWEDTGETFDADALHPVIIAPERYHHVLITGPVSFAVEFYFVKSDAAPDAQAPRPGEKFLGSGKQK